MKLMNEINTIIKKLLNSLKLRNVRLTILLVLIVIITYLFLNRTVHLDTFTNNFIINNKVSNDINSILKRVDDFLKSSDKILNSVSVEE